MALDTRQRNPFGQFAQAVSSSPEMMKKAYGPASPSIPGSALLALLKRRKGAIRTEALPSMSTGSFAARLDALVEFARGDLVLPELARNGVFGGSVRVPDFQRTGVDVLNAARSQGPHGSAQQRIRSLLAKGLIRNRQLSKFPPGSRQLTAY